MDRLKVSILIPAYNVERYLSQCLDSVLNQTYSNLQVVIVDDGSKDNTLNVCERYAENDKRVEYYHQENQGVSATRNHLLEKVQGEYILFIDADDWVELDMVEYLMALATEYSARMVMCDRVTNYTKPDETTPNIITLSQEDAVKDFLLHDYFVGSLCNKLIHHSLIKDVKFHTAISYGEDALFIWHVLQKLAGIVVSTKQLYHYRMNEDSISHQSFGEKKLTGHLTWQLITDDVRNLFPQYLDIALSTFALQDMYLLRAASQTGYNVNAKIRILQNTIRRYIPQVMSRKNVPIKELVYINIICRCYLFGRIYYFLHKCKM